MPSRDLDIAWAIEPLGNAGMGWEKGVRSLALTSQFAVALLQIVGAIVKDRPQRAIALSTFSLSVACLGHRTSPRVPQGLPLVSANGWLKALVHLPQLNNFLLALPIAHSQTC